MICLSQPHSLWPFPERLKFLAGSILQAQQVSILVLICGLSWFPVTYSQAYQALSGISASYDNRNGYTNDDYVTTGGGNGSAYLETTMYNMNFNSTTTNNLIITGFQVGTNNFGYIQLSDRINIERMGGSSSNLHLILYELVPGYGGSGDTNVNIRPSYVRTMEESLRSPNINRGADNVFCNQERQQQ